MEGVAAAADASGVRVYPDVHDLVWRRSVDVAAQRTCIAYVVGELIQHH